MTIKFHYNGTKVKAFDLEDGTLTETLTAAIYRVVYCKFEGFYLERQHKKFKVPKKVYGNTTRKAKKIITTFNDRDRSTGILLTGDKGSGKTMLAEVVCNKLISKKIPIIIITERFTGSNFIAFINSLGVIGLFFDEFGKIYPANNSEYNEESNDSQEALLSLMDGGGRQKRLVMLTENQDGDINEYFRSRPGRVYYHFKYGKLGEDTIKEFLGEQDLKTEISDYIVDASRKMKAFSFDILQAIVEEYHRYGGGLDGIEETLNDLNISYDKNTTIQLKVTKLINKDDDKEEAISLSSKYIDKPSNDHNYMEVYTKGYDKLKLNASDEEESKFRIYFRGHQLEYDSKEKMVFDNGDYILVAEICENMTSAYNYSKA